MTSKASISEGIDYYDVFSVSLDSSSDESLVPVAVTVLVPPVPSS